MSDLKQARLARGWSQQQLAAAVGCSQVHVSRLERGRQPGSLRILQSLAAVLGVPLERLVSSPPMES